MVKASYERHYIRDPCRAQREGGHSRVIVIFKKKSQHESKTLRKEEKRKKKRKLETRKENREIEWQTCTNRLILSLPLQTLPSTKDKMILLGTSHLGSLSSKWLISTAGFSLGDYSRWGEWFPPWSWSYKIAWHGRLIFFFLFLITHILFAYFHHFLYKAFLIIVIVILIGDYLFTLSKGESTFFYYYYYHICLP